MGKGGVGGRLVRVLVGDGSRNGRGRSGGRRRRMKGWEWVLRRLGGCGRRVRLCGGEMGAGGGSCVVWTGVAVGWGRRVWWGLAMAPERASLDLLRRDRCMVETVVQ